MAVGTRALHVCSSLQCSSFLPNDLHNRARGIGVAPPVASTSHNPYIPPQKVSQQIIGHNLALAELFVRF